MPDYRKFYEKDYLGAWDIPEGGGDLTLTIVSCSQGELHNPGTKKKTKKPVVRFRETEKGMALNATNGKSIAGLYGNMVEKWPGKRISLYKSTTRNPDGSGDVDCLRIRNAVPASSTAAPPARSSQEGAGPPPALVGETDGAATITEDQVTLLETMLQDAGIAVEKFKETAGVARLALLPADDFDEAIVALQKRIDKRKAA